MISSLDEYLLVKELDKNKLFVINHLTKRRFKLPKTNAMGKDENYTFNIDMIFAKARRK